MAEQLCVDEIFRHCGTVEGAERTVSTAASPVDSARHKLLPRTTFPFDQDRERRVRRARDGFSHLRHAGARPDKIEVRFALGGDVLAFDENEYQGRAHSRRGGAERECAFAVLGALDAPPHDNRADAAAQIMERNSALDPSGFPLGTDGLRDIDRPPRAFASPMFPSPATSLGRPAPHAKMAMPAAWVYFRMPDAACARAPRLVVELMRKCEQFAHALEVVNGMARVCLETRRGFVCRRHQRCVAPVRLFTIDRIETPGNAASQQRRNGARPQRTKMTRRGASVPYLSSRRINASSHVSLSLTACSGTCPARAAHTTPHVDAHGFEIAERSLRFCFARPHQRLQNRRAVGTGASAPDRIPDVLRTRPTHARTRATRHQYRTHPSPCSAGAAEFEDRSRIIMTPLPEQRATEADGGCETCPAWPRAAAAA